MTSSTAPVAQTISHVIEHHGEARDDPYAWLRVDDWQAAMRDPGVLDERVRDYLEAENAHTAALLADTEALQVQLVAEMRARMKEDDASVPDAHGPHVYYARYAAGAEHPMFCRRPRTGTDTDVVAGPGDGEELLLDADAEAGNHDYYDVGALEHSPDHALVAWSADVNGSERYQIRVRDLTSGALLDDLLDDTHGDFVWSADCRYLFYTVLDDNQRPQAVRRHRLGTAQVDDETIYTEPDAGFFVGVSLTESRRFVVIATHDHTTSESYLVPADSPLEAPALVAARERDVEYDVSHHGERLVIRTNADEAEDFKLVEAPLETPARSSWHDLVAHRPGCLIVDFTLFAGHLVRLEREHALPRIVVRSLDDGAEHAIEQSEAAYSLGLQPGEEFDTTRLRYVYSSPATPARTYDYDMSTRERWLRKSQEVPSGHDPQDYVAGRDFALAPDGERVPLTWLRRRDTPLDGSAPVLLYGYGAYGISIPAAFSTNRLSLVDRGFIHVVAHVRGGMECGYRWYREGKLAAKTNTFTDFIAAAEHLVAEGMTTPERIAAHGASAGGMLMGAVANLRPDLFGAIVAEVPFVDVLNTMCDDSLPLTPPEWPEWGDPLRDRAAFDRMAGYSPYDNVRAQAYPAILATAGISDPRVTYWEPAKWVARLRATRTDDRLLALKTNMTAGHGGAAGRFDRLDEVALAYAFVLKALGTATTT